MSKQSINCGGMAKFFVWLLMSSLMASCMCHQIIISECVGGVIVRLSIEPKMKEPRLNVSSDRNCVSMPGRRFNVNAVDVCK